VNPFFVGLNNLLNRNSWLFRRSKKLMESL
jgi:hypothetical protein